MAAKKKATSKRAARKKAPRRKVQVESDQRKYARRANLVLFQYLIDQCWMSGRNLAVVGAEALREYYGVGALSKQRIDWLREDAEPWFGVTEERSSYYLDDLQVRMYLFYERHFNFIRVGFNYDDEHDCDNPDDEFIDLPSIEQIELYRSKVSLGLKRATRAKGIKKARRKKR